METIHIQFTTLHSSFGQALLAATERGLCAVFLGDEDTALVEALSNEFPNAGSIERDKEALRAWAEPVVRYLEGKAEHPAAPVDLHGTAFQQRVWRTLQEIPFGETRTYAEVAMRLGKPAATRAVAGACAANKIALVVPCHRVVRGGGAVSGYRWGLDRKRRLLELEGKQKSLFG